MFTTDFIETESHAKMFIDIVYYEALFLLSPYKMYVSDRGILLHRFLNDRQGSQFQFLATVWMCFWLHEGRYAQVSKPI